jgi:outer membrane protein
VSLFCATVAGAAEERIAVIDSQKIITQHPSFEAATQQLRQISRNKETEARAAADSEPDEAKKAQLIQSKRMELAREEQRLMEPILKDADLAVRTVAKNKKFTVVLEKASVYFGGVDITDDVVQQIKKQAASTPR